MKNKLGLMMAAMVIAGWMQVGLGQNLNEGLVAYYPFNGNANDESGNGNDGEVSGATLAEDRNGESGKAYSFDGENDYISASNVLPRFDVGSFSLWVKADSQKYSYIINKKRSASGGGLGIDTAYNGDFFALGLNREAGDLINTIGTKGEKDLNKFYHLVGVSSGTHLKLYVDSVLLAEASVKAGSAYSDYKIFIGGSGIFSHDYFHGTIDDIRIYNRALSESEVAALYELESKPLFDPKEGLVAYYPFNGNAKDASGNGNHGEVNGATLADDRFGSIDMAYKFDGVDDYVSSPNTVPELENQEHTVSAWIRSTRKTEDAGIAGYLSSGGNSGYWLRKGSSYGFLQGNQTHGEGYDTVWANNSAKYSGDNSWHFLVGVRENGIATLYFDGVKQSDTTHHSVGFDSYSKIYVGWDSCCSGSHHFQGSIDDIRFYNRALSNQEVAALYELESKPPSGLSPVIFDHPIGIDLRRGESVVLSVGHTGTPSFEYQWFQGGIKLRGQTKPYLFLEGVTPWDSGNYTVSISNLWGTATSNPAKIVVTGPPDISTHPISVVAGVGSDLFLSVQADGTPPLSYQWYKNGVALEGAAKASYFSGNVSSDNIGAYTVIVSNDFGQIESNEAQVTVGTGVSVSVDGEGLATIYLKTETDGFWVVEASSDLKEWTEVNAIKTTNGEAETTDIRSLINESRFYRAKLLQ